MPILRQSCTNCTSAKRKCVIQKPRCVRCAQKELQCVYDLEPLNAPPTQTQKPIVIQYNPSNSDERGVCIMKTLELRSSAIDPAICAPGHGSALDFTKQGFDTVPGLIREGKPALFVHPMLKFHGVYNHFSALVRNEARGVRCDSFRRLVQLDITALSLKEALTALQALLVHLAASVFSSFRPEQEEADRFLTVLSEWRQALLERAEGGMPKGQSPWQDWLLAESVRRTIFMAYVLPLCVFSYKKGYCANWLFMESLPFDARPGLWMAESPQAWNGVANVRSGEEVGERLNSFHEFAETYRGQRTDFCGDLFMRLVESAHNGPSGN